MESSILLSFILPVYNVQEELPRCLDSILKQTMDSSHFEVIAVDDGSSDNSAAILDRFALEHSFFRVHRQSNHGLGAARNTGLKMAEGKYIVFIDSDDYILPSYAEKLVDAMTKTGADMGICDAVIEKNGEQLPYLDAFCWRTFGRNSVRSVSLKTEPKLLLFQASVWRRIFKRDFVLQKGLLFPESLLFEDIPFHYRSLEEAESVALIPEALYVYMDDRGTSITKRKDRRLFDFLDIFSLIHRMKQEHNPFSYVLEHRHLKWASRQLDLSLKKEFLVEMKKSLAYYSVLARLRAVLLRLRIKIQKGLSS